jgi:lysophospholipase L1-like esterase
MAALIKNGEVVLFQGDSVTDCHRVREDIYSLGEGYPSVISAMFSALYPEKNVAFINKGVSGDRSRNLQKRWQADCIDLKPDWVTILIGINDTWRRYDSNDPTSAESFEASYRDVLTRTKEQLDAKIIMMEPFVLPVPEDRKAWREDLDLKLTAVRKLAVEFADIFIPLDGIFAAASVQQPAKVWAPDGVHPSIKGHGLIAKYWLEAVKAL